MAERQGLFKGTKINVVQLMALNVLHHLDNRAKMEADLYQFKLATYSFDPAQLGSVVFPEFDRSKERVLTIGEDPLFTEGEVVFDLTDDDQPMTLARMEEIQKTLTPLT